jgi:hypothetical protein
MLYAQRVNFGMRAVLCLLPATCYLLPAPYITMCDFFLLGHLFLCVKSFLMITQGHIQNFIGQQLLEISKDIRKMKNEGKIFQISHYVEIGIYFQVFPLFSQLI